MAKSAKIADDIEPRSESVTETITYVPGEGGPSRTVWGGHTFHANLPKELTGHPDGTQRERLNMHMIETARASKFWTVGNAKPKRDPQALPTTAMEYRAYMIEWLKDPEIQHAQQLIAHFARDHNLREACEVGTDDYNYLATLFMPKLYELQRSDELSDAQLGSIWINHGINELPWSA